MFSRLSSSILFHVAVLNLPSVAIPLCLQDQLASAKKCGHLGGKVLVPTREFIQKLTAARLAADVLDVPTLIVARTDALGAYLLTSDADERDKAFTTGGLCGY